MADRVLGGIQFRQPSGRTGRRAQVSFKKNWSQEVDSRNGGSYVVVINEGVTVQSLKETGMSEQCSGRSALLESEKQFRVTHYPQECC